MEISRNNHPGIYPAGPTYVRSIKAGATLYISGTTARNSSAEQDMAQLDVILDRITRIVNAEGGKASDIVSMTTYVTDMSKFWPIEGEQKRIWENHFPEGFPTNSYVEVRALAEPELTVEITTVAICNQKAG